jgi:acyl dehydratase
MDLKTLEPGYQLLDDELHISRKDAAVYQAAVGDKTGAFLEVGGESDRPAPMSPLSVPPMAVAARAMALAMQAVELPAGAVHTAQELAFIHPVPPNALLHCTARVGQNSVRGGARFLTLEFQVTNGGTLMVEGRAFIAITNETAP